MAKPRILLGTIMCISSIMTANAFANVPTSDCDISASSISFVHQYFQRNKVIIVNDIVGANSDYADKMLGRSFHDTQNMLPVVYRKPTIRSQMLDSYGNNGVLVIASSLDELIGAFRDTSYEDLSYYHMDGHFLFIIASPELTLEYVQSQLPTSKMAQIFDRLWTDFNLLNAVVVVSRCAGNETLDLVGYYDPFENQVDGSWGQFYWTTFENLTEQEIDYVIYRYVSNFNGKPLKVNQFYRYPTALRQENVPEVLLGSYIYKTVNSTNGDFSGFDGLVLQNLEDRLNFTKANVLVQFEYGYMLDNGTFVGSIGEILRKEVDASFNGRFIKYYDTFDIDFMFPVFFDKFCIVAPKSLQVPQWLAIFQCFNPMVWSIIILLNLFCGFIWFAIKHIFFWFNNRGLILEEAATIRRRELLVVNNRIEMRYPVQNVVIEMWNIMFSSPSFEMPNRSTERILMTACLMANVIISGTFQGSLYTAFSTTTYYRDIETLQELDDSGLNIYTGSKSIMDIFGEDGTPLMRSLNSKMILKTGNESSMDRAATKRDACCVERKADLSVMINTKYITPMGIPMVQAVDECPRDYHVAYITRKNWPLLETFNRNLMLFSEAGLINQWYAVTETAIIDNYRLNNPSETQDSKALTLIDNQTSFYLLGSGLLMCVFVFVGEFIRYHRYSDGADVF